MTAKARMYRRPVKVWMELLVVQAVFSFMVFSSLVAILKVDKNDRIIHSRLVS